MPKLQPSSSYVTISGLTNVEVQITAVGVVPKMVVSLCAPQSDAVLRTAGVTRLIRVPVSEGSDGVSSGIPVKVSLVAHVSSRRPERLGGH